MEFGHLLWIRLVNHTEGLVRLKVRVAQDGEGDIVGGARLRRFLHLVYANGNRGDAPLPEPRERLGKIAYLEVAVRAPAAAVEREQDCPALLANRREGSGRTVQVRSREVRGRLTDGDADARRQGPELVLGCRGVLLRRGGPFRGDDVADAGADAGAEALVDVAAPLSHAVSTTTLRKLRNPDGIVMDFVVEAGEVPSLLETVGLAAARALPPWYARAALRYHPACAFRARRRTVEPLAASVEGRRGGPTSQRGSRRLMAPWKIRSLRRSGTTASRSPGASLSSAPSPSTRVSDEIITPLRYLREGSA